MWEFYVMSAGAAVLFFLAMWQGIWLRRVEGFNANLKEANMVLLTRMKRERKAAHKNWKDLGVATEQLTAISNAQRAGARRIYSLVKALEVMTLERDRLLANVILDMDMDRVFKTPEDADAYLARRNASAKEAADDDEPFFSATPAETTKARDQLMQGFDNEVLRPALWDRDDADDPDDPDNDLT